MVGVSYDSIESHKAFIANHSTFVIGKDGAILYANPAVNPATHSRELLDVLSRIPAKK